MSRPIVAGYVAALKRKGFGDFISINQRLGKDSNKESFGEKEYAEWFGPEYRIARRAGWRTDQPSLKLPEDLPGRPGYQLLHFTRA